MEPCEMKDRCGFFNDLNPEMFEMSYVLKGYFCDKNKSECARYKCLKMFGSLDRDDALRPNQEDYLAYRLCLGEFF